jgi:nicotinate phosphoribosyltransferase
MGDRRDLTEGLLFIDQYQLTMAQLYWKNGLAERTGQFDYFFRSYPDYGEHQAGYAITAGLGWLLDWLERGWFRRADRDVLASQTSPTGTPRFDVGFLDFLSDHEGFASLRIRAVAEGRVVHANEPVAVVEGPLAVAQILETSLLNHLNHQTLIATKASRVVEQARGGRVLEFGMRRGPGTGANSATRASLIGGADGSSNVGVSHSLGVDPRGTHGHSMVQLYMALGEGEIGAFRAFAELYPDECVLLVDTIDTLESGMPNAITVFEELRARGHEPLGIRLDSGDLAYLAVRAAAMLDAAGFPHASIVLSSDLDELAMWQIREQIAEEAPTYGVTAESVFERLMYGVGTRLVSSHGHPALGGVYKLVAIEAGGTSVPAIKVSDTPEKVPIPGRKHLWRIYDDRGLATADVISGADETVAPGNAITIHHPHRANVARRLSRSEVHEVEEILEPAWDQGGRLDGNPDLDTMRQRRVDDLARLDPGVRRLVNPHRYHVSVTTSVKDLQDRLVSEARRE